MMMHVFRPVGTVARASASRLLATQSSANSSPDFQVGLSDSSGGFVAVQQPNAYHDSSYAGATASNWYADSMNVASMPVIYPMHSVFNTPTSQESEWPVLGSTGPSTDEPFLQQVAFNSWASADVATQAQPLDSPQPLTFPPAGSMIFFPAGVSVPVMWGPTFRACEFMQMPEAAAGVAPHENSSGEACAVAPQSIDQVVDQRRWADVEVECDEVPRPPGTSQPLEKQPQQAAAQSTSGARRQRRSRRGGAAKKSPEATMHLEDVHEVQCSAKSTEEACLVFQGAAERGLHAETQNDTQPSRQSWADALEDEFPSKAPQHLPVPSKVTAAAANVTVDIQEEPANDEALCADEAAEPMLLALANTDSEHFRTTLDEVISTAWSLAVTKRGCRIVQKALEVCSMDERLLVVDQLHGRVLEALKSPHANHVLQKCIEVMPPDHMQFVLTELQGEGTFAARHRFGCRILQRAIEHGHPSQTEELIAELLDDSARLCRHQYGNFVIQHILQHGSPAHRVVIAEMLCEDTIRLAKHRIASHVLSCAMVHCAKEDVQRLTKVVLQDAGQLADLSRRQYGSFVVREVNRAARLLDA